MSNLIEIKVPDIGDFTDVPVIDVLVKPGDSVQAEDPLVTLESDKATMDVPAPAAGTVKELRIKLGDKVSEGALVLLLEAATAAKAAPSASQPAPSPQLPASAATAPISPSTGEARGGGVAVAAVAPAGGAVIEVKVPDIGDFTDVPVIDVLVKPGDSVQAEDPLVTLESDKATMDVPSPAAGVVKEMKLKVGDTVSEGSLVLTLQATG